MDATYSRFLELDQEIRKAGNAIPLSWVKSTEGEDRASAVANFGDALSPVVATAISRLPCHHRNFDAPSARMVSVGTIGHAQRRGSLHFWGTGVDARRNTVDQDVGRYMRPPETEFHVHALRGPLSRAAFLSEGISAPEIYGDPAWFMPRILAPKVEKTHELGVIVHISELESRSITAKVREDLIRYHFGAADGVRIISTYHQASWPAFQSKLEEILSCKRIVSTSFHGLIIPQAYGIPALYFPPHNGGPALLEDIRNYPGKLDHRMADFFAGAGYDRLHAYRQPQKQETNWNDVISYIDKIWEPLNVPVEDFLAAFPAQRQRSLSDADWSIEAELANSIEW